MHQRLSRRSFLELTGLAAMTGCSSSPPRHASPTAMQPKQSP
jgi:hypothetical protein